MVRTQGFHCGGLGSIPVGELRSHKAAQRHQKKKRKGSILNNLEGSEPDVLWKTTFGEFKCASGGKDTNTKNACECLKCD